MVAMNHYISVMVLDSNVTNTLIKTKTVKLDEEINPLYSAYKGHLKNTNTQNGQKWNYGRKYTVQILNKRNLL